MPRKKTLIQKINSVRRKVDYIQKDSKVQNQYTAVSHDAVTSAVRQALIDNGLIITPPSVVSSQVVDTGQVTSNGTPVIRYEATYRIAITDGESSIEADIEAHANDQGDKAPGKAMSYASKYFMLKLFNLETGDEEESRIVTADQGRVVGTAEYAKVQDLISQVKELGDFDQDEYLAYLKERGFNGKDLTELTQGIYPIAIGALHKKLKVMKEVADG